MLFTRLQENTIEGKPKAMVIMPRDFEKMEYITGFAIPIIEYLHQNYHVIVITGKDSDITHYKKWSEIWGFSVGYLNKLKDKALKRSDEMEGDDNNWEYNQDIIVSELIKSFGSDYFSNLEKVLIIDPIDFILPQTSYVPKKVDEQLNYMRNEFHDTIRNDDRELEVIKQYNDKTATKYYSRCSVLAFGSHNKNISMSLVDWSVAQATNFQMVYGFINDPAFYTPIFVEWDIPFTAYYFANDARGSRDFKEFPIGELQHLVWDMQKKKKDLLSAESAITKDRDFFFAGTIFQEKGGRVELYKRYMRDLRLPDSALFIPQRANGIVYTKKNNDRYINKLNDKFSELHKEILEHPLYAGHLVPAEYEEEVKRYRYGLLLRCVSHYDSLNFRPILYSRLGILPLIDPSYDPMGLQIPLDIQEHLLVADSAEIENRVKYFNENPAHREELLKKLEYKFNVKEFEKNWKNLLTKYI